MLAALVNKLHTALRTVFPASRRARPYGEKKYIRLMDAARNALSFGCRNLHASFFLIQLDLSLLETYENKLEEIDSQIQTMLLQHQDELFVQQIHLLNSIPGIGLLSAAL